MRRSERPSGLPLCCDGRKSNAFSMGMRVSPIWNRYGSICHIARSPLSSSSSSQWSNVSWLRMENFRHPTLPSSCLLRNFGLTVSGPRRTL